MTLGLKKKDYLKSSPKRFFTKEKLDHSENQELYSLKDITRKVKRQVDSLCSWKTTYNFWHSPTPGKLNY